MDIKIKLKVKEIRKNKGISVRQLAGLSGISKSQISAVENGESMPTILTVCQLALALNLRPEELYEYEILM